MCRRQRRSYQKKEEIQQFSRIQKEKIPRKGNEAYKMLQQNEMEQDSGLGWESGGLWTLTRPVCMGSWGWKIAVGSP